MIRVEHNVETNEIIEITLSEKEVKEIEKKAKLAKEKFEATQAEAEAKATERQAILDRLGLTADEAKLLLG